MDWNNNGKQDHKSLKGDTVVRKILELIQADKRIAWLIGLIILAIAAVVGVRIYLMPGVTMGSRFCRKESETLYRYNDSFLLERTGEDTWRIMTENCEKIAVITVTGEDNQVTAKFSDGKTINGSWDDDWHCLDDSDGIPMLVITATVESEKNDSEVTDIGITNAVAQILIEGAETRESSVWILIGAGIYILGILYLLYPYSMIFLFRRWWFRSAPELSDTYLFINRIGSLVCMGIGLFITAGGPLIL